MARHLGFPRAGALAILALTLAVAPVTAQSPSPSAQPAPVLPGSGPIAAAATSAPSNLAAANLAMAALMSASDLPDGFSSDGPKAGSDFGIDQAAFDAHGGQAIASQVWNRSADSGPIIAFDFRMVFPTAEDATAYLADAEATLSERQPSNLKRVKGAPSVGEHHRLYTGSAKVSGLDLRFQNHLFTVGPIAAKVFVTAEAGGDPAGDALAIAQAAADQMTAAVATPDATPVPTVAPVSTPEPSIGPDVAPMLEAILQAHVPEGITDCQPVRERAFDGELAAISCPLGTAGEVLVVRQLDSPETLATVFAGFGSSTPGESGACRTGPSLEPRMDGGVQVGQLDCYDATDGTRVFIWTDERFDILSWFVSTKDRKFKPLYALYAAAGPVAIEEPATTPQPSGSPSGSDAPFPTDAEAALLSHMPDALRDSCGRSDVEGVTAALECGLTLGDGTVTVTYRQYPDAASMDAGYGDLLSFMGVDRDAGPCSGDWPAEAVYNISKKPAGRVGCSEFGDTARFIAWTDDRFLIQGYAEGFSVAKDDLYQWWLNDSGPF